LTVPRKMEIFKCSRNGNTENVLFSSIPFKSVGKIDFFFYFEKVLKKLLCVSGLKKS
jgi:hypothetical protein